MVLLLNGGLVILRSLLQFEKVHLFEFDGSMAERARFQIDFEINSSAALKRASIGVAVNA